MTVTIKDIANASGVSYSTVSKALRNSPLVKPDTKKKVLQVAEQLGYSPNFAARSLASKKSQTIGLVWPT
ncbi:LacI family DNA-binding transcriptional regulator, partial [Bacillus haynesii]